MANDRSSAVEYRMLEELPSPPPGAPSTVTVLTAANLTGAIIHGAKANEDTIWPAGFDTKAAGVIFD